MLNDDPEKNIAWRKAIGGERMLVTDPLIGPLYKWLRDLLLKSTISDRAKQSDDGSNHHDG